ncbi:MAG TPA: hypothetical protein V6D10_18400 [Trichocoleus sp.]|jgi:hypothetical protein
MNIYLRSLFALTLAVTPTPSDILFQPVAAMTIANTASLTAPKTTEMPSREPQRIGDLGGIKLSR